MKVEESINRLKNEVALMLAHQDDDPLAKDIQTLLSEIDRLNGELENAQERVKELENNIPNPEWCCAEHKKRQYLRIEDLESQLSKLKEAVEKHKYERGDYAESTDEELYKVLEECR